MILEVTQTVEKPKKRKRWLRAKMLATLGLFFLSQWSDKDTPPFGLDSKFLTLAKFHAALAYANHSGKPLAADLAESYLSQNEPSIDISRQFITSLQHTFNDLSSDEKFKLNLNPSPSENELILAYFIDAFKQSDVFDQITTDGIFVTEGDVNIPISHVSQEHFYNEAEIGNLPSGTEITIFQVVRGQSVDRWYGLGNFTVGVKGTFLGFEKSFPQSPIAPNGEESTLETKTELIIDNPVFFIVDKYDWEANGLGVTGNIGQVARDLGMPEAIARTFDGTNIMITDQEMSRLDLKPVDVHGEFPLSGEVRLPIQRIIGQPRPN